MRYGYVRGIDTEVSRCVLGTSGCRDARAFRLLDAFFEQGGTCLDTARIYAGGESERVVGRWLRQRQPDRVVLLGKGAHPPDCTPGAISNELTVSLDRLGVSRVDLYLLHRDNPAVPAGEFVDALEDEVAAGRIAAYGASNWTRQRLIAANHYAAARGFSGMVALSNHFSLAEMREPLYPGCEAVCEPYREYLARAQLPLFPWSAQARGFFADVDPSRLDPKVWRCWDSPANRDRRDRARRLAGELGLHAINVALAYVLSQPFPTFPIIGPADPTELAIALAGADLQLAADQRHWLESGTPARTPTLADR